MKLIKSAAIALSMYSQIPVPQINWDKDYMKHALCFLPLIGAIIGGIEIGWYHAALALSASIWIYTAVAALIPVIVTGGIHIEGLMDTTDALASLGDSEKRHSILKDPHVGAFAVIHCCMYFVITCACFAFLYEKGTQRDVLILSLGYIISRAVCALCVVTLPTAKDSGLAYIFKNGAGRTAVTVTQIIILTFSAGGLFCLSPITAAILTVAAAFTIFHFRLIVIGKFAGITGDLAGFILTRVELVTLLSVACGLLIRGIVNI